MSGNVAFSMACPSHARQHVRVRHGAAVGLREVLRSHAAGAGVSVRLPTDGVLHVQPSDLVPGMVTPEAASEAGKVDPSEMLLSMGPYPLLLVPFLSPQQGVCA
eukprot:scaffold67543_cov33-Prasinocladus_malaysianus.AAC.3